MAASVFNPATAPYAEFLVNPLKAATASLRRDGCGPKRTDHACADLPSTDEDEIGRVFLLYQKGRDAQDQMLPAQDRMLPKDFPPFTG
jgi:hypothetical protein